MKAVISADTLMHYPDHNKPFHVYADASTFQLGAVILQDNAPVAFFSRKLTQAQRNYTTIEKELLSIVMVLKEFRLMLFGCRELHVYTNHRNLTYSNLKTERVLRWRLDLKEYNPVFDYVKGPDNKVADSLSRLPSREEQSANDASEHRSPPYDP
jgi:RNase H-like domain found in reverse transcriptase